MATLGAILNLRLTLLAVSFLMYCVISLCVSSSSAGVISSGLWKHASGKVQVCLCWVPLSSNQYVH